MIIKLKVTMQINFISSKDSEETRTMNTKSSNIGIIMGNETDEIIKKLFDSLLQKYQDGLEESIRGNEFIRYSVGLLYYYLQKIGFKRGGSYIDSPEWLKNKRATINPKNNDDSCFQYALKVIRKEYRKLNLLLVSIIGKKYIIHHIQRLENVRTKQ